MTEEEAMTQESPEAGFARAPGSDPATAPAVDLTADGPAPRAEGRSDFEDAEPPPPEAVAEAAETFVRGLLDSIGVGGEVTVSTDADQIVVDITGDGMGLLIGRRGQTLEALQELTRTAVQRHLRARTRVQVDVEGYRARRRSSLVQYAHSMAERAKERGTEIELEPMTASERKIVHDAVGEIEGASSYSEGVDPSRKVIIRGE
ncbi:MAG: protein jag [Actinomycetota bacterium]|nr:protein jag [Actinomycetota bacterium]